MKKILALTLFAALLASGCVDDTTGNAGPSHKYEEGQDIVEVDGKVRFYLSVDDSAPSLAMGAAKHIWSTDDTVRVNNNLYRVQAEGTSYYVDVKAADDKVYRAGFYETEKYFPVSCFTGVFFPYSQYYKEGGNPLTEYPMYALYSQSTGNRLKFKDGYAVLGLTLKGSAAITSVRVEDAGGTYMGGDYSFDNTRAALSVSGRTGVGYVVLNCGNEGNGVQLSSSGTTLYIAIPARDYSSGLRLAICDRDHLAMFHTIPAADIAANTVHSVTLEYAPDPSLCFYEGFDTFVWGGNIVAGDTSIAHSPDATKIGSSARTDFTGYEESLAAVACNNPGTGYLQSVYNTATVVADNHLMSESYLKSRNLFDWKYLFRCQEYQGFVSIGAFDTARGIIQTPPMARIGSLGDVEVSFKFAVQAGFDDAVQININNGGLVTSVAYDGEDLPLTAANYKYDSNSAILYILLSQIDVPADASQAKTWHTLSLKVKNANNGTSLYLTSLTSTAGNHGIYLDDIKVVKESEDVVGPKNLRVLFWNIQNGMWSDQGNNYDNFVNWVKTYDPDICIWCEAQSIYTTGTSTAMPAVQRYLTDGWGELAARYGHTYWDKGGHRDNYPQVITSKYPITSVQDIVGSSVTVSHGAGHATVTVNGREINIVTLHLWPQSYAYGVPAADQAASTAANGGDYYRESEIIEILDFTINNTSYSGVQNWIMAGDFNSRNIVDNWKYAYPEDDPRFLVHNYIAANTTMMDVIASYYPGSFLSSTSGASRIDYVYASPAMYALVNNAVSVVDSFTTLTADSAGTGFYHPSDHRPILVDFTVE